MKQRLDVLVLEAGLAESREKAQRLIRAGAVSVNGQKAEKPGQTYPEDIELTLAQEEKYVSRGAYKLEGALQEWGISLAGRVAVDIGASTGGFTDLMLQAGARFVHAIDVGRGQLHWKIRQDERVASQEGVNARYLEPHSLTPVPDFGVVDVSFISLTKILPPLCANLAPEAELVTLIKPQFEAGRSDVGKGGVVRDPAIHEAVVEKIRSFGESSCGLTCRGVITSPIKGPAGNIEFLAYWAKEHPPGSPDGIGSDR